MLGQPDALQPDDEHELQPAAAQRGEQVRGVAEGERADPEQREVEQRVRYPQLDRDERGEHQRTADEAGQDEGAGPAHDVVAVGLDAVGDADEHRDQADREGDVAPPVHAGGAAFAGVAQLEVGPDRAEHAERHGHEEHQVPVDGAEQAADHQPEERAGDRGDAVDAQRRPALPRGEGVGEDRAGVGHQAGAADALDDPPADQPQRRGVALHPGHREQHGRHREDQEAEVVDPDAAVHVAQPPEPDDQHGRDDHEAHEHPQQVAGVAGRQRIDADAAEDVGHRDEHDRGVDRGHEQPERRVGQRHPLVARVVVHRCVRRHPHPPDLVIA